MRRRRFHSSALFCDAGQRHQQADAGVELAAPRRADRGSSSWVVPARHVARNVRAGARAGGCGSTTRAAAGRRRACRARSCRGRRGRASPGRCAGRRRPRAGASRTSGAAGAGGRAPARARPCSARRRRIRNAPARVSGAALRVQEELRPVAAVEVRAAAREVAAERLDGVAADRDDALLVALADARGRAGRRGRRRASSSPTASQTRRPAP